MSGYHRTGGNLRSKRKSRKVVDVFTTGQHIDPRMRLTLADIKQQYPEMTAVPKRIELINDQNKWNRRKSNDG